MQSDKFDKKIKEAAEHHHPSYNEKAWDHMEKLLNKHLPQKEERKRRFLFILLFLLLLGGGSAWLMIAKPWEDNEGVAKNQPLPAGANKNQPAKETTLTEENTTQQETLNTDKTAGEDNTSRDNVSASISTVSATPTAPGISGNPDQKILAGKQTGKTENNTQGGDFNATSVAGAKGRKQKNAEQRNVEQKNIGTEEQKNRRTEEQMNVRTDEQKNIRTDEQKNIETEEQKNRRTEEQRNVRTDEQTNKEPKNVEMVNEKQKTQVQQVQVAKNEEVAVNKKEETKKKKGTVKKPNSLFLSVSTGPDISFVGTGNSSKVKMVTGLGIGYTIREKFTIRTGFYSARKIYSAKPSDYKAPPEFYQFYPYLEKVDADCKVYEIPVLLSYNFGKKSNWFVSAGLSTFLMNEESYNYFYKYTPTGNTYSNRWTIKNENAHFFSVGTLSAGYKRNLSKRVSFMAEPYIKVPFGGVGYGKVKLNSGGVLFSLGIKVF